MRAVLIRVVSIAVVFLQSAVAVATPTDTASYNEVMIHGWLIRVSPDYADDENSLDRALAEIDRQLDNISQAVPEPALSALRRTVFWLEYRADDPQRSVYHRSSRWLANNGFNPDKAKGIEIDAGVYSREEEAPWSLLHELTHAYYDTVLNRTSPDLEAAYAAAVASGAYKDVLRNTGSRRAAYALTNVSEYFAELSEAYFGENDFEPFDRDQLRTFDPQGYRSVQNAWTMP